MRRVDRPFSGRGQPSGPRGPGSRRRDGGTRRRCPRAGGNPGCRPARWTGSGRRPAGGDQRRREVGASTFLACRLLMPGRARSVSCGSTRRHRARHWACSDIHAHSPGIDSRTEIADSTPNPVSRSRMRRPLPLSPRRPHRAPALSQCSVRSTLWPDRGPANRRIRRASGLIDLSGRDLRLYRGAFLPMRLGPAGVRRRTAGTPSGVPEIGRDELFRHLALTGATAPPCSTNELNLTNSCKV